MAKATQLLSVMARINPAIYDYIFPHGPVWQRRIASRFSDADRAQSATFAAGSTTRSAAVGIGTGRAPHRVRRDRRGSRRAGWRCAHDHQRD